MRTYDLENRLVDYGVMIIDVTEGLANTRAANYIAGQLIRSGLAPALLYGEAQSAESRNDFVHKMKLVCKELKESRVSLKFIIKKQMLNNKTLLENVFKETEELVAIVSKSIDTAIKNNQRSTNT